MHFLTTADINHFFGGAPKLLSAVPMIRKQGNGNLTGFVRKTFADGSSVDSDFIVNAKTRADVVAAYHE